ncbi:MAG: T9SS type A sorting domain-containing protein, partial [Candidatus Cloacimonetes bacterium]|nr:T9SS type A sorting domain-containing protein [Candidatus Cloacimonadota bacterium]
NPFNPETTINYSLKENAKVSLNIYNIKGQKVKTLVDEQLQQGEHSAIWNGRGSNGNQVSSGIYFYKMKTDNFEKTRKMILIK